MDRRAEVVDEPGESHLARAEAAADLVGRLANEDRASGARELDRCCKAVRPGADDDGVVTVHAVIQACLTDVRLRSRARGGGPGVAGGAATRPVDAVRLTGGDAGIAEELLVREVRLHVDLASDQVNALEVTAAVLSTKPTVVPKLSLSTPGCH